MRPISGERSEGGEVRVRVRGRMHSSEMTALRGGRGKEGYSR